MSATNLTTSYSDKIEAALPFCLKETNFSLLGKRSLGKVRDSYDLGDRLLLITTDRLTAFDRQLALIPFKGQVLNLISAWWFEQTADLIPNHVIAVPDPNAIVVKKCHVFPIEFVVRGYITGTTNTSLWTEYSSGSREYCGLHFPDGLRKNQQLPQPVLTPTTKEAIHDRPVAPAEIIAEKWMTEEEWHEVKALALKLYHYGVETAKKRDLILVDTKYEFGRDREGNIIVVDEIHTPDSSRYWRASSYEERFAAGLEPENIDKEFLRLWFAKHCDPYQDADLPQAPEELVLTLSSRYIQLYEMITGRLFDFGAHNVSTEQRIIENITHYLM